jgi:RNA polymerase sigma-70 factor (ECF subfamily)
MIEGALLAQDIELLKRVSKGDEEAFRQLYDLTHRKVYFYLYRLVHGRQMAEDILVETYTEVWRNASKFKGKSRAGTWIIGIARNLAMNQLRKVKVHEDIDLIKNLSNGSQPNGRPFDRKRVIKKALLTLSTKHQEVLDLVFFHGLTYQEVSEILGIPINTVKTRVFYAKESLKQCLNQLGVKRDDL